MMSSLHKITSLTFLVTLATAMPACHPLEPSNVAPDRPDFELKKDDPSKENQDTEGEKPAPKTEDDQNFEPFTAENEQIGTYRGYAAITSALASRIAEPGTAFDLVFYLDGAGSSDFTFRGELYKLLGSYVSDGLRSDFQNGLPNGINLLVWHLAFSGLGDELGSQCILPPVTPGPEATHPPIRLKPEAKDAVANLCRLSTLNDAQRNIALDTFWHVLTGWELPDSERVAWIDWSRSSDLASLKPEELISALTEAALFNPHFLLRK